MMMMELREGAQLMQSDSTQPGNCQELRRIDLRYAVVWVLLRDGPQVLRHRRYLAQWLVRRFVYT